MDWIFIDGVIAPLLVRICAQDAGFVELHQLANLWFHVWIFLFQIQDTMVEALQLNIGWRPGC